MFFEENGKNTCDKELKEERNTPLPLFLEGILAGANLQPRNI